jgi:ABC-type nitrate/sulfonate/bicarbonate transport system substrate-binding protein
MSAITGVPITNSTVSALYNTEQQSLPPAPQIDAFLAAQQTAITQLATGYCGQLVDTQSLRDAFFGTGLDASITSEPLISIMAKQGLTTRFATVGSFYPNQQAAVVCYGAQSVTKRPEVGRRFMKAYLQGVRDYNDALKDGRTAGPNAEEIIDAIARYSVTKDRDLIRTVIPAALHPDGEVNVDGLAKDLAFIKTLGLVKSNVAVTDIVDMSFAKAAVAELGPYKGRTG